jgi:hypothetical protein
MPKVVQIYNNTVHSAFKNKYTLTEVQDDSRLECEYIKECEEELKRVDELRTIKGFNTYEPGSILLVHIPLKKTPYSMRKRRRNFDELATFVKYESGNAVVDLLHPYPTLNRIVIPICFTKFIANSLEEMRQKYGNQFIIDPSTIME